MLTARRRQIVWKLFSLLLMVGGTPCASQTIHGIVHNGTNGKSQAGDLVVVTAGAREISRTVSAQNGSFRIDLRLPTGTSAETLKLRVVHDGVAYQQPVKFGFAPGVTVYDGARGVNGLSEYLSILQFESRVANRLEVTELHAILNDSWPRLTSVNPANLDLSMPKTARNLFVTVTEPDGQSAKLSIPDLSHQPGPLRFGIPLQPGLTKYALSYELPYVGKWSFRRSAQYSTKETILVLPMSMRFVGVGNLHFKPVADNSGAQVREVDSLAQNDILAFQVEGTGVLAQAFRPIGDPGESTRKPLPIQSAITQGSAADKSSTLFVSNPSNRRIPSSSSRGWPKRLSVRTWAISGIVFLLLGTIIAWRVARARYQHRAA